MFLQRQPDFGRESMNEFCTQFDSVLHAFIKAGEYTATDAVAGLDDLNPKPSSREIDRRRKAGNTGAENQNVR